MFLSSKQPIRIFSVLLEIFTSYDDEYDIVSDLDEIYKNMLIKHGRIKAIVWIWKQVILSIFHFSVFFFRKEYFMFKNYIKVALRTLKKYKIYSLINISGLAIGMVCFFLIMLWVRDELSFNRFHENSGQIYLNIVEFPDVTTQSSPWSLVPTLKNVFPETEMGTRYIRKTVSTRYKDKIFSEEAALVDAEFLKIFTFPIVKGDPNTALSANNSVVITERTAEKYFGDEEPLGKIIKFDNRVDFTVTGVIRNVPANSDLRFDFLALPELFVGRARMQTWSFDGMSFILLKKDVDLENYRKKISGTINKYGSNLVSPCKVDLQPLNRMHLYSLNGTDPVIYVYTFTLISFIVLLIACINFMNLTTAKSSTRMNEIGMRKVFGANRNNIIRQFLSESVMLSIFALFIAVILVYILLPSFNNIVSKQLKFNLIKDISALTGLVFITLVTGLVAGSYPSFYLSSFNPSAVIKGKSQKGEKNAFFRKTLIIVQFTAVVVLLISTLTIYNQISFIQSKNLGFNRKNIINIPINRNIRGKYQEIKKELLKNNNILNVTAASSIPLDIGNVSGFYWEGKTSDQWTDLNFACIDYDYFETFNMEFVKGRSFSKNHSDDIRNYIINESAAKLTGFNEPVGKKFAMWSTVGEIVGVVKDFHSTSLRNKIPPLVFLVYNNLPYFNMFVRIKSSEVQGTIETIKNTFKTFDPEFLFQYTFLEENFRKQYINEERIGSILKYFSILAISIGCLGLFGLSAFMAERRKKEIAVRKVLGSPVSKILGLISGEFVLLVMISNILAGFIAYKIMAKWLLSFTYKINIGINVFLISGVISIMIALITVSYFSLKAACKNPVDSLKYE